MVARAVSCMVAHTVSVLPKADRGGILQGVPDSGNAAGVRRTRAVQLGKRNPLLGPLLGPC